MKKGGKRAPNAKTDFSKTRSRRTPNGLIALYLSGSATSTSTLEPEEVEETEEPEEPEEPEGPQGPQESEEPQEPEEPDEPQEPEGPEGLEGPQEPEDSPVEQEVFAAPSKLCMGGFGACTHVRILSETA